MKCEICHEHDAQAAIDVEENGEVRELYVCSDCEKKEKKRRQAKRQRTRKEKPEPDAPQNAEGDGFSAIMDALSHAFSNLADNLEKANSSAGRQQSRPETKTLKPIVRKSGDSYHVRGRLHLEGLNLIGEIEAVHRAMRALGMSLVGLDVDGVRESGHAYLLEYTGSMDSARRVETELLAQECNARIRLFEEMPRVFSDALCRALALLKNCRLLSPGELFDLLSPLRLAAYENLLDGIDVKQLNKLMEGLQLDSAQDSMPGPERDALDAARADEMNKRFEEVVVNDTAGGKFL